MVQQNPALIQPLLQQIAANNPALAQMITENPEQFYQYLAGGDGEDGDGDFDMGDYGEGEGGQGGQGGTVIELTPSEAEAVRRVSDEARYHQAECR